ncbi:cyclic nucleotide-binding domain-containing protein [Corallococcus coralloides]|uniref:Cyclic nucleotide-binding domain-containing protein n=2 Tax=Corallococcus coralloides TaxID=184914 RepID=A0A410RID4_CORCK|nr:cyclic nucleotide-binding domain-containing protein [Corallococcus coralloides]
MSERESMKLRELKEAAHALYQRGRYAQCVETYAQLAKLLPRDANVRVRLAEACRRAGQKEQAIAAYRKAAKVLLSLGCESRARGALKAALELDPRDPVLQQELARMGQGAVTPTALEDEDLYRFDRLPPPTPPPGRMRSVPPSITPVSVRGTPSAMPGPGRQAVLPHPRPATPARDSATEKMSRSMAQVAAGAPEAAPLPKVIVSMSAFGDQPGGNTPPRITPVTVDRSVPQKVLPAMPLGLPALLRSPPGVPPSTVNPASTPERPTVKVLALMNRAPAAPPAPPPSAVMPYKPEMRRLAPNVVALRVSPQARWVIIRSESELEVSRSEELPGEPAAAH